MKKRSTIVIVALLLLLVVAVSPTLAHERRERQARVAGEVTAVDIVTGQITLDLRFRDPITVQTSEETEFFRKVQEDGLEPITIEDLVVGDKVHVSGAREDELFQASKVVVMPADGEPPFGEPPVMARGAISELDADNGTLTVEHREGDPVVIQTSEETKFFRTVHHGRLEQITFDDLAVGDWIKSEGEWDGDVFNATHVMVRGRVHRR